MEKNPAAKFQKNPGKIQKWACVAREARGARPFLGIFQFVLEFSGICFPYNTVVPWHPLLRSAHVRAGLDNRLPGLRIQEPI